MAEEAAIDLTIKTGEAEKNTQSLKSKLKELKQQMSQLKEGSAEFNAVAKEAGKLEDKIGDINQKVRTLASDTKRLDAFVGAAQGIAGGFAAAQGAVALFGGENEELNKTLLKVQGSLALLNGVEAISNTFKKENALVTNLQTEAQALYTTVVGTSTGALKLFRIALAATGIGLVVVAIGELVAHWEDLTKWISGSTEALDKNIEATKSSIEAMKSQQKQLEQNIKDSHAKEIAALERTKAIREAYGLDTIEIDKQIYEARIRHGESAASLELENYKKNTEKEVNAIKNRKAAQEKADEEEKSRLQKVRDESRKMEEDIAEMRRKDHEDAVKEQQEEADKLKAIQEKSAQEEKDRKKKIEEEKLAFTKKRAEDEKKIEQQRINDSFQIARAGSNALMALNNLITTNENNNRKKNAAEDLALRKKQFERGKALAIVNTVINTAQAIMAQMSNPTPYVGIALAALAAATGAIEIATISSQKFDGGGSVGISSPSAGSTTTPSPTGGNNSVPTIPNTPQSIPIPQQVYVTETDISGTQHKVNVIENLSKIH